MPTTIRIAHVQPRAAFPPGLPSVTIFLVIGLIQLAVALLFGGDYTSFSEQSLWF